MQVDWSDVAKDHKPPPASYEAADGTIVDFTRVASTKPGNTTGRSDGLLAGPVRFRSAGPATYVGANTVWGVSGVDDEDDPAGNVDVRFPAPVDRIVITYSDTSDWKKK